MNEEEKKVAVEIVDQAIDKLREHFDSVLVLATSVGDDGVTEFITKGSGNQLSRVGMARQYLIRDKATITHDQVQDIIREDSNE